MASIRKGQLASALGMVPIGRGRDSAAARIVARPDDEPGLPHWRGVSPAGGD
jgi:hypothetical protein